LRHRNHLGVMTASALALTSTTTVVDLRSAATGTYGTEARKTSGSAQILWAGNTVRDNALKYTGTGNDRDPILIRVGSTVPTNTVPGYYLEDVNMDGLSKYTGSGNDRDPIIVNIGATTPTNTRAEQLP
jgi:large repetitive protein